MLAISDVIISPILKIKKKCLCCGEEMELYPYVEQDFCDICFPVILLFVEKFLTRKMIE